MATRRRWPYVVLGIAVLLVFVGIGVIVAGIAWFQENMEVQTSTERDATTEFDAIRQKFGGREPLLVMEGDVPRYSKARVEPPVKDGATLSTFNILAWDPDEEKLARITLPFWLLRMKSDPIQFSAYASGLDEGDVNLRPEDIEKYGAGVILDTGTASGERVLLWAQ